MMAGWRWDFEQRPSAAHEASGRGWDVLSEKSVPNPPVTLPGAAEMSQQ